MWFLGVLVQKVGFLDARTSVGPFSSYIPPPCPAPPNRIRRWEPLAVNQYQMGHKVRTFIRGISVVIRGLKDLASLLSANVRIQEVSSLQLGRWSLPESIWQHPDVRFPVLQNFEKLFISHPVYGNLFQQPKLRQIGSILFSFHYQGNSNLKGKLQFNPFQ